MDYIERNRDFKGVWIPKDIWLNENLTMLEKVILIEIDSLDNEAVEKESTGCILSPCLFTFYAESIMRNAGPVEAQVGIKIARRNIVTSDL